jgi:hypothetical protein
MAIPKIDPMRGARIGLMNGNNLWMPKAMNGIPSVLAWYVKYTFR